MFRLASAILFIATVASAAVPPTGRYKKVLDRMNALQAQHPAVSSIFSIGTNDDGVEIYAMRISTSPKASDPTKIGHLMVSTHHGNELGAPEFTLAFLADLLNRYDSADRWRANLHDMEFSVIPVLNISGYNANQRAEHGRDPNRDYPSPCTNHPGGALKSIRLLMDFMKTRLFAGSVTVHGYDGSLTYPWGMYTDKDETLDDNQYRSIFQKAATYNGYRVGTAGDVVYPANGCFEDWVYWKHGSWSLLLELRDGSSSDIRNTVPAIAAFYDQLNSSPSNKNQFLGSCTNYRGPDLRVE